MFACVHVHLCMRMLACVWQAYWGSGPSFSLGLLILPGHPSGNARPVAKLIGLTLACDLGAWKMLWEMRVTHTDRAEDETFTAKVSLSCSTDIAKVV